MKSPSYFSTTPSSSQPSATAPVVLQIRISDWICRSALSFALLAATWQFSASATPTESREHAEASGVAQMVAPDSDRAYSPVAANSSTPTKSREHAEVFGVGGIDCITALSEEKEPSQDGNDFPDSTTDLDDTDSGLDDLSAGADSSTRNNQDTPLFSVTGPDAVTLRTPRIVPILLLPVHCFYCLHEHIRERAPPTLS
jgi:hypothetical protein